MTDTAARRLHRPGVSAPGPVDGIRLARRVGLTGSLLMAGSALGSGALPVPNPLSGIRLLGLPARNTTLAIALTYVGMGLLIVAWVWVARALRSEAGRFGTDPFVPAPGRGLLARTALLWAAPLAVAPPLFSRDVYSYLAQGEVLLRGLDPYLTGPAAALGVDDPLVRNVPAMWRGTPAPYGPLSLVLGRGVADFAGDDAVLGIMAHRLLALVGIAAMVWALPRLAARCGADGNRALWLGAAHPMVLFHLVSGVHNDGLMIGLFLAGLEVGLRGSARLLDPRFLGGAVLIVAASAVKLPALLVLGFLGMEQARRRGGRVRDVTVVAAVLGVVAPAVYVALGPLTTDGWGWLHTVSVPSLSIEWMSLTTDLGLASGQLGLLVGLGDHTDEILNLTRGAGLTAAALGCVWLLLATLRGRFDAVTAMAAAMGVVVLFGPSVQPWYLLWAVVPLAATTAMPRYRTGMLGGTAVIALLILPTGAAFDFHTYQLLMSIGAALVILVAALWLLRRYLTQLASRPSG
ncbi:polyprenol phosphomannose-dependent alpha 1,6 mannosyltransferase MptB [Pseudonocardia sp. GCM10023141]|uniref:polyprenol phosphomannose-dependent alpha 1,6 mannosyltransferase MptB n=1 Tax=Pseudonocardia sp. GCM10023141 TaxID=3252653 RepID=UPI00360AC421